MSWCGRWIGKKSNDLSISEQNTPKCFEKSNED